MCKIDWDDGVDDAAGVRVFPSPEALKAEHPMWQECGIVEVELTYMYEIVPQNLGLMLQNAKGVIR